MLKNVGNLSKASLEFLEYLSSDYGKYLLQKNKLKIHVEIGEVFMIMLILAKTFTTFLVIKKMKSKKLLI